MNTEEYIIDHRALEVLGKMRSINTVEFRHSSEIDHFKVAMDTFCKMTDIKLKILSCEEDKKEAYREIYLDVFLPMCIAKRYSKLNGEIFKYVFNDVLEDVCNGEEFKNLLEKDKYEIIKEVFSLIKTSMRLPLGTSTFIPTYHKTKLAQQDS